MDLQRSLFIAAILVVSVLVLRQWNLDYYEKPSQNSVVNSNKTNESAKTVSYQNKDNKFDKPLNTKNKSDEKNTEEELSLTSQSHLDIPSSNLEGRLESANLDTRELYFASTDVLKVAFDTKTANVISAELLKYPQHLPEKGEGTKGVQLLVDNPPNFGGESTKVYVAQTGLIRTGNEGRPYNVQEKETLSSEGNKQVIIEFYKDTGDFGIQKRYILESSSYKIELEYTVKNYGKTLWEDRFYAQLKRDGSPDPGNKDYITPMSTYMGAAVKSKEKSYHKLAFDDFSKEPFKEVVLGGYAAILQHYFLAAWIPNQNEIGDYYTSVNKVGSDNYYYVGFQKSISANPGEERKVTTALYIGPKIQDNLKQLADGLELTVDYGILWFLARPIFQLLCWLQEFLKNWGWSIVLLTIIIKGAFYPLNATSFRSMAKMRMLSPKMQELKERYGNDKQKLSLEMMSLYKKEKVNPMGGCLPVLVQMPVFIALYWVLLEAVELRQAPWIFWIKDLSQIDPYFILPLCMGASMYIQQTLSPAPPDPTQAKVMRFMPVIFTVFFLWFPSGLVLYWLTNNILSIAQQYMVMKQLEPKKKL